MPKLSQQQMDESLKAARELGLAFRDGQDPPSVNVPINIPSGETCVGHTDVKTFQWLDGDGAYMHKSGGYLGLGGLALVGTANLIGNTWRRVAAGRAAAPQWRALDQGRLYVTTRRLAVRGEVRWTDIAFTEIRMVECEPGLLVLEITGAARIMLELSGADYWFVMLRKLIFDDIFVPPEPSIEPANPKTPRRPERILQARTVVEIPDALIGDWVGAHDENRTLIMKIDGTFQLHLNGREFSGPADVTGERLKFDSPGLVGEYHWTVENDRLTLEHPGGVSEYVRVVTAVPAALGGRWTSLTGPSRVLSITERGTYALTTEEGESPGRMWMTGNEIVLQTADLAPSLYSWAIEEGVLTMTRRDGSVSRYARQADPGQADRPRYGDL